MNIVILAAGAGKRMHSDLPKVLHCIAGRTLLDHVLTTARALEPERLVVVYGHAATAVRAATAGEDIHWVLQSEQRGTAHAVMQALPHLDDRWPTLILSADVPLLRAQTLAQLETAASGGFGLLTVVLENPFGYGRIIRDNGAVRAIVEHRDATDSQHAVTEINTGVMQVDTASLRRWLARVSDQNAQREYYLTDIVGLAVTDGLSIGCAHPDFKWETLGVNDKAQLAELERAWQLHNARHLMESGVTLMDPSRIDVRGSLKTGRDVSIDVGCIFEGDVELGANVRVGPYCVVRNAHIEAGVEIAAFTHIDGARVGSDSRIGPFARLRPGSDLAHGVHIGNFVEVKNSTLGPDTKANHLSYLGDATLGARVNIGAGTITCNYDGAAKHRTVIGDDVHVGSDVQLVAPVEVGNGATIGAGTTVWQDVAPDTLAINPKSQSVKDGWKRAKKSPKK